MKFISLNGTTPADVKSKILADPKGAKFTVHYFNVAGNGLTCRDILAYSGAEWKNTFPEKGFPAFKADTPFGVLPLLTIEKEGHQVMLAETCVINTYLARQFGLLGDNAWEEQYILMLDSSSSAVVERVSSRYTWNVEVAKEESLQLIQRTLLPEWIASHEACLEENGNNGHYVGNKLSLADIRTANVLIHWSCLPNPENLLNLIKPDSPLWKVKAVVEADPRIKAWHDSEEYKELDAKSRLMYATMKLVVPPKEDNGK